MGKEGVVAIRNWSIHGHFVDRENRYLLFLTENYAALGILKQYLQDQGGGHPLLGVQSEPSSIKKPWEMEPFVLFGSSFPKDKEYTQVNYHDWVNIRFTLYVLVKTPHWGIWLICTHEARVRVVHEDWGRVYRQIWIMRCLELYIACGPVFS